MLTARFPRLQVLTSLVSAACFVAIALQRTGLFPALTPLVAMLYQWAVLLGAISLLLGAVSVSVLHVRRIQVGAHDWMLSLLLVAVMVAVFVAGLINPDGVESPLVEWVFDHLIAPGQAALLAVTALFMGAAAFRYLRVNLQGGGWVTTGALAVLLTQMPWSSQWLPPEVALVVQNAVNAPVTAALRGLLLGAGLGAMVVGLRIMSGRN